MFYTAYMCLQAEKTPCTILYLIKGQKVDVGKGVITKPLELMLHSQPIPAGHFRVTLLSVTSGHEDLPPPLRLGGEDDETPPRIWKLQGLGAAMAKESSSSGAGREHTNNHTSTSMYGDHHPAYAITSSCSAG